MRILVTGGAGYLGSVLVPKLLLRGHDVRILDVGYFGVSHLQTLGRPIELVRDDLRRIGADPDFARDVLDGIDCVIHLAAISNDPSAELNPELTEQVNLLATVALARACRDRGIRFVFSSSCSVYGDFEGELDEDGPVQPLTTYARSKVDAERDLEELASGSSSWSPVILRNGTLFGYSPRMRFDLVANIFALHAATAGEITIFGDGLQWRPFLHVSDCARAFIHFAERTTHQHLRYNIAHENLRVVDLIASFRELNPQVKVQHLDLPEPDRRNYRVSAARAASEGYSTRVEMDVGVADMMDAIISGRIADPDSIYYRNAKWLKELSHIGSKNHRDLVSLMEAFGARQRFSPRPALAA